MASRLVRRGASLKEIADFLGHRDLDTTAIYAQARPAGTASGRSPLAGAEPMTTPCLLDQVNEYLAVKRALGFELETPRWMLRDFARYAQRVAHPEHVDDCIFRSNVITDSD